MNQEGTRLTEHTILVDATPLLGPSGNRGIGRYIYDLLHGLAETRDEWRGELRVRAVVGLDWAGIAVRDDLAGAAAALYAARDSAPPSLPNLRRVVLDAGARVHGASLLHLTEAVGTPLTHLVRRVVTCHDLIPLRLPEEYLPRRRTRFLRPRRDLRRYRQAERVVAVSEGTRADLHALLRLPLGGIDVVPNGIDLSHFQPVSRPGDEARLRGLGVGGRPFVLYVGSGDPRKNIPGLLRAVTEARRRVDLELVWAGGMGPFEVECVRAELARQGLLPALAEARLLGFVSPDDLAALYRAAVAHVFLSRLEGFGLTVTEAMASGCPVIVGAGSGTDETSGDAAIAVDPRDVPAAAAAIVDLATRPDERARRRAAGLARAARLSRAASARGYLDVWRRLLARRRPW
jgi:glycosyltransferase involved in cell wall biosynthesis